VSQEIELKLTVDEAGLARVPKTGPFAQVDFHAHVPRHLKAIYFDTETNTLRLNGIVLRLRDENGRLVQTLKSKKHFGSLAAGRAEYEFTVRKNRKSPDLKRLPDKIKNDVALLLKADRLHPVFQTDVERKIGYLETPDGDLIEVALDRGLIKSGEREMLVSELELELKKGHPSSLYRIALDLVGTVPLRIGMRSKSERGFALAYGLPPSSIKVETVQLQKSASVEEALEKTLRHCLSHIVANEPALVDARDGEALHQMRVALRRLRAALEIFAPVLDASMSQELMDKARDLSIVLGAARDLDVFRSELLAPLKNNKTPDLEALDKAAEIVQATAWERALGAVRSPEFTHTCLSLALYIEERSWHQAAKGDAAKKMRLALPAKQFAAAALDKRLKKAKALARNMESLSLEERHALRKQLKRLRYAIGFFSSLYGKKKVSLQLQHLSRLQDVFGSLNDLAVAQNTVSALVNSDQVSATSAQSPSNILLAKGAGRLLGWHGARADAQWSNAMSTWAKFRKTRAFWRK